MRKYKPYQRPDFSTNEQMFWKQKWAQHCKIVIPIIFEINFAVTKAFI